MPRDQSAPRKIRTSFSWGGRPREATSSAVARRRLSCVFHLPFPCGASIPRASPGYTPSFNMMATATAAARAVGSRSVAPAVVGAVRSFWATCPWRPRCVTIALTVRRVDRVRPAPRPPPRSWPRPPRPPVSHLSSDAPRCDDPRLTRLPLPPVPRRIPSSASPRCSSRIRIPIDELASAPTATTTPSPWSLTASARPSVASPARTSWSTSPRTATRSSCSTHQARVR